MGPAGSPPLLAKKPPAAHVPACSSPPDTNPPYFTPLLHHFTVGTAGGGSCGCAMHGVAARGLYGTAGPLRNSLGSVMIAESTGTYSVVVVSVVVVSVVVVVVAVVVVVVLVVTVVVVLHGRRWRPCAPERRAQEVERARAAFS